MQFLAILGWKEAEHWPLLACRKASGGQGVGTGGEAACHYLGGPAQGGLAPQGFVRAGLSRASGVLAGEHTETGGGRLTAGWANSPGSGRLGGSVG